MDKEAIQKEVEKTTKDYKNYKLQKKIDKFYRNREMCKQTLFNIINLAETAYHYRIETNGIIDRKLLADWMQKFISGDTFTPEITEAISNTLPTETDNGSQANLDITELKSQQHWLIDYKTKEFINLDNDFIEINKNNNNIDLINLKKQTVDILSNK